MKLLIRKFKLLKKYILSLPRPALLLIGLGIILILPMVISIISQQISVNLTKNLPTTVTIPINSVDVLTCSSFNDTDISTCQANQGCTWNASFRECSGNLVVPVNNPPGDPLPKSEYVSCEGINNSPLVKLTFRAASNATNYRVNIWKEGETSKSFRNLEAVVDINDVLTFTWTATSPIAGGSLTGPAANTKYNWEVAAQNGAGFSNFIAGYPFTTSNCDGTGAGGIGIPEAISETHITCTNSYWKSRFNFKRGSVNGTPGDAYLDLKPDDGFGFGQGSFQGRGPIGADSYEWTDIKANTKYVWRVTMLRPDGGYAVSNEKKFTTPACTNTGGDNTGGGNTGGGNTGGGNTGGGNTGGTTNPPATPACLLNKNFPIPAKDSSKPPVVSIHLDIKLATDTNYTYLDIAGPLSPDATSYTIRDLYPNTSYNVRTWMHTGNGEGYYAGLSSFTMGSCPQATATPVPNSGGGGNTGGGGGSSGGQVSCDSECKKQVGTMYCSSGTAPIGGSCTCTLCSVLSPAAPTATKTPTPTATKTPTPIQSAPTATKTPTPIQGGGQATATPIQSGPTSTPLPGQATATPIPSTNQARIAITLDIPGLGTNKALGQNPNPVRNTRTAQIKVFDANNTLVKEVSGQVAAQDLRNTSVITNITSIDFAYRGTFDLGTLSGNHTVKARFDNSLWKTLGIANFVNGQTVTLPLSVLTTGDIDQNNELNLVDYNLIVSCYGTKSCSQKEKADLNLDGKVDELDLNILYAGFSKRQGD